MAGEIVVVAREGQVEFERCGFATFLGDEHKALAIAAARDQPWRAAIALLDRSGDALLGRIRLSRECWCRDKCDESGESETAHGSAFDRFDDLLRGVSEVIA